MAATRKIAVVAASVALAGAMFYLYNVSGVYEPYMGPLKRACGLDGGGGGGGGSEGAPAPPQAAAPPRFHRLGVGPVDALHCLITPFMLDIAASPAGRFWLFQVSSLAAPAVALVGAEECRAGAPLALRCGVPLLVLAQLLGISIAWPGLWLPAFVLLRGGGGAPRGAVPAGKAAAIAFQAVAAAAVAAGFAYLPLAPEAPRLAGVALLNLAAALLPLVWVLAPRGGGGGSGRATAALAGPPPAVRVFRVVAFLSAAAHVWAMVDLFVLSAPQPGSGGSGAGGRVAAGLRALAEAAAGASTAALPANFMMWDVAGLLAALGLFCASEFGFGVKGGGGGGGPRAALARVGALAALGPGAAFALACAEREERAAEASPGEKAE